MDLAIEEQKMIKKDIIVPAEITTGPDGLFDFSPQRKRVL
jgi:hypothetical protein